MKHWPLSYKIFWALYICHNNFIRWKNWENDLRLFTYIVRWKYFNDNNNKQQFLLNAFHVPETLLRALYVLTLKNFYYGKSKHV